MMSRVRVLAAAAALVVPASVASAEEAYTTRIEPRPFYGATVTIEEGVRVFRPLPTTRHVIVNPGGTTPLHLSIEDVRVTEHRTITGGGSASASATASGGGGGGIFVPRGNGGHRGHGSRGGHHGGFGAR